MFNYFCLNRAKEKMEQKKVEKEMTEKEVWGVI